MLKLDKCKKILTAKGKKYTDEEVRILREQLYKMANIINDVKAIENEKLKKS